MDRPALIILGIPIDNFNMTETVERTFAMMEDFARDGRSRYVATVNVDFVVNALGWGDTSSGDAKLLSALRNADMVVADGMPVVWCSRLSGKGLKERVTGADLAPRLAEAASRKNKKIYFLGGREETSQKAIEILKGRYPGFQVAGASSPWVEMGNPKDPAVREADDALVETVNKSGADILLIAFGNPKQEFWFERVKDRLKVPVSIGVGGTFEFIAGNVSRAPRWMQKVGLEWIYRLSQEPKRLVKRYTMDLLKFVNLIAPLVFYRFFSFSDGNGCGPIAFEEIGNPGGSYDLAVKFPERLDSSSVDEIRDKTQTFSPEGGRVVWDWKSLKHISQEALGKLFLLATSSNKIPVQIINKSEKLSSLLKAHRIDDVFEELTQDPDRLASSDTVPADAPDSASLKYSKA